MESLQYISVGILPGLIGHNEKQTPDDVFAKILYRRSQLLRRARLQIKRCICQRDGKNFPFGSNYDRPRLNNRGNIFPRHANFFSSIMPNYVPNTQIFSKKCSTRNGHEFYLSGSPMGFSNDTTVVQLKFTKQRFPIEVTQAEIDQVSAYIYLTDSKRGVIIHVHNSQEVCNEITGWYDNLRDMLNSPLLDDFVRRLHYLYLYSTNLDWWIEHSQIKLYDVDMIFNYLEDGEFDLLDDYLLDRNVMPIP